MAEKLTDDQNRQLVYELQAGRKLAAVKLYKEWTGSSLLEAKNYVESELTRSDGKRPDVRSSLEKDPMDRVLDAIQAGKKLEAVKIYKASSGASLMESKQFVEHLMRELGVEEPQKTGCLLLLMVVAVGARAVLAVA